MARVRKDTTRKSTPLTWARVFEMGVTADQSSKGHHMIVLDFQLHPSINTWPVKEYMIPKHPNEFVRQRWLDFVQDQADQGCKIKGRDKSVEVMVELSEDWLMPECVGYIVEEEEYKDKLRETIRIKKLDWTGEHLDKVDPALMEWPDDEPAGDAADAADAEESPGDHTAPAQAGPSQPTGSSDEDPDDSLPF